MKIIFYVHRKQKYLDFQTLLSMYDKSRSDLYRYLLKSDIETICFNNKKLYNWDHILMDTEFMKYLDFTGIINEIP